MEKRIDLHTHSNCSDGTLSPAELAYSAKERGLSAIALTDHDTNKGISEFLAACEKFGIEGVGGIELSTSYKKQLHIVGLYLHGEKYEAEVERLERARMERNIKMLKRLREEFGITEEDVFDNPSVTAGNCGRLHMAKAIVKKGYAADVSEAFDKYLKRGRPCYVKKYSLSPAESIRLIKDCGGIAIWAHPVSAVDTEAEMLEMAGELKAAGLDAMECMYNNFTPEQSAMCRRTARAAKLYESGGSDFHGSNKPGVELGRVSEGFIPYEVLERLKSKRELQ